MLRAWVRGVGLVTALIGILAFAGAPGINPKRDTSIFHNLADLGLFIDYGFILVIVGVMFILLSFVIPSRGGY
jgi:hypothetical protein